MAKIKSKNKYCFASEFEAARHLSGFSYAQVAKICGRDLKTIKNWESGFKPCPQWALRLIVLESRYMNALYGLQQPREERQIKIRGYMTHASNDAYAATWHGLQLVLNDG